MTPMITSPIIIAAPPRVSPITTPICKEATHPFAGRAVAIEYPLKNGMKNEMRWIGGGVSHMTPFMRAADIQRRHQTVIVFYPKASLAFEVDYCSLCAVFDN